MAELTDGSSKVEDRRKSTGHCSSFLCPLWGGLCYFNNDDTSSREGDGKNIGVEQVNEDTQEEVKAVDVSISDSQNGDMPLKDLKTKVQVDGVGFLNNVVDSEKAKSGAPQQKVLMMMFPCIILSLPRDWVDMSNFVWLYEAVIKWARCVN
ncbi:hypothetical protein GLOIN_2v1646421 [Rhizophagus clarus]|uniref:Uncharacterized protein n=2 Tax=Rhizophagus clarus TaxID=94130 RepID=A0A8H3M8R5_9GLOM|nr:hypothetical protein GLOIN_2v1646421 [Rhizophagus clarus]